jgi:predicted HAD superfamily Cof-like phosphohydrolase
MSKDWISDIHEMHAHFSFHEKLKYMPVEHKRKYLEFRMDFLQEELDEMRNAVEDKSSEEVVDALIDLCVVAIGTLDAFNVDGHAAWDEVYRANMEKRAGIKESRPNPLGLPDLMKPIGWIPPNHDKNHGDLPSMLTIK